MTPRLAGAPATFPPSDQAPFRPTTTGEKWGQIRPSRWGQRKSSFSPAPRARLAGRLWAMEVMRFAR